MNHPKRILTCQVGDEVVRGDTGKKVMVAEILDEGCEYYIRNYRKQPGTRADITMCAIMSNRQVLIKRNPVYVGQRWHYKED